LWLLDEEALSTGATEDSLLDLVYQTHGAADQAGNRKTQSDFLIYSYTIMKILCISVALRQNVFTVDFLGGMKKNVELGFKNC